MHTEYDWSKSYFQRIVSHWWLTNHDNVRTGKKKRKCALLFYLCAQTFVFNVSRGQNQNRIQPKRNRKVTEMGWCESSSVRCRNQVTYLKHSHTCTIKAVDTLFFVSTVNEICVCKTKKTHTDSMRRHIKSNYPRVSCHIASQMREVTTEPLTNK